MPGSYLAFFREGRLTRSELQKIAFLMDDYDVQMTTAISFPPSLLPFQTVLILAVVAATATCKTTPRTRTRAKAKTKSSTASFFVDDDSTTAATTKMKRRTTESPSIKSDDKRLSLNSLLGNWDYSLTSEDYYYYYYFDDDEESAAKTKVRTCPFTLVIQA